MDRIRLTIIPRKEHIALQTGGPEIEAIQKGIDGFPKRLVCVLEFKGQNVDNQKKRCSLKMRHLILHALQRHKK